MEKRIISLPQGGTLEVDCTEEFYDAIRKGLKISDREITDKDVSKFIYEAFRVGVEKAERELSEKVDGLNPRPEELDKNF